MGRLTDLLSRHSSIRHTHITEEIKKTIVPETEIAGAINTIDNRIVKAKERLQEAFLADPTKGIDEEDDDKSAVLQEIHEERVTLEASRKVLERLLSTTQERTGISITNVRVSEGGRAATGLLNTREKYVNANITIENIDVTKGGKVIAGIAEDVNLDNFF